MKVVYNWLKDFVDVTAPPDELASRLALSGTNIGERRKRPARRRDRRGSILEQARLPGTLRNRQRSQRGIQASAESDFSQTCRRIGQSERGCARRDSSRRNFAGAYTARVIRGVKIQPSPPWLRERLEASGVASISNVVDVSNYVMLELGQPLHAFDYDKVRDHRIVVRRAKPGEKMHTLDGIERTFDPGICMIADGDGARAVGIGGIMGGAETEISFSTKNVLIECAWFDPIAIRRATRFLKLHTEASTRYGRGADPEMAELASRRCRGADLAACWRRIVSWRR